MTELKERNRTLTYELFMAKYSISVSSIVDEISLQAVTNNYMTLVSWFTEYFNDFDGWSPPAVSKAFWSLVMTTFSKIFIRAGRIAMVLILPTSGNSELSLLKDTILAVFT